MPAIRVRVRPAHKHKGLLILWSLLGIFSGIFFTTILMPLVEEIASGLGTSFLYYCVQVGFMIVAFMPPLFVGLYMGRCCQHKKYAFLSGQLVSSLYVLAIFLSLLFAKRGNIIMVADSSLLLFLAFVLLAGLISGLANLLINWVYINYVSHLVVQDGSLCVNCGYVVIHSPSEVCSECGTPKEAPITSFGGTYHFAEFLGRRYRILLLFVLILILFATSVFLMENIPIWKFCAKFAGDGELHMAYYQPAGGSTSSLDSNFVEVHRILNDDAQGRVLIILCYHEKFLGEPLIQLRIGELKTFPGMSGQHTFHYDGTPRVVCELDEQQTKYIMGNDIPESLIEEMIKAADDAGWKPYPTAPPWPQWQPDVVVLANKHFPPIEVD